MKENNNTPAFLNKVELIGVIGRANTTRIEDKVQVSMSFVTQHAYKGKDGSCIIDIEWHNIVAFMKKNDKIVEKLTKGTKVHILGRIKSRRFISESGEPRSVTEIVASEIETIDKV